jgi:hypothetical protein
LIKVPAVTTFFSYNALVSQRSSGYRNTTYALAELIDNSFDAEADAVHVVILERKESGRRRIDEILVLDDGKGMTAEVLQGSLQFGNTTNTDLDATVKGRKKGKFGYGLPNASLSQSPSVHVYSWQNGSKPLHVYLDLEELKQTSSIDIPRVKLGDFPAHYRDVLPEIGRNGTLVAWRRCDRLSHARGDSIIKNSKDALGRLYRHLLAGGKRIAFSWFEFNDASRTFLRRETTTYVRPSDPLFLMENTQIAEVLWKASYGPDASPPTSDHYKPFAVSATECRATNLRLEDKCFNYYFEWLGRKYEFEIVTTCADIRIQKPGIREGGNTKVGAVYGDKERLGNISFVRAEREIASGHFGFYKPSDARHRWWSIEVRFSADADDLLGLHNNKQGIEFVYASRDGSSLEVEFDKFTAGLLEARQHLWEELTAKIDDARREAFNRVKDQHSKWDTEHVSTGSGITAQVPIGTETTKAVIKKVDGPRPQPLPEKNKQELFERLQQKYPDIPKEEVLAAVTALDQALVRGCVLYAPSDSTQLWSFTKVFDFTVVLINTRHEFFSRVLSELRVNGQERALTAIELFISSLAVEEERLATRAEAEAVETFRSLVGIHLNNYIKRLPENFAIASNAVSEDGDDE